MDSQSEKVVFCVVSPITWTANQKSNFLCRVANESELGFLKGALEPEEIEAEEEEAYANRPASACKEEHLYPTKESD